MLDKLLSKKLFFIQIIIIVFTSGLGILLVNTDSYLQRYSIAIALFAFNWYLIVSYFNEDQSLKENNYAIWFYSIWMIPFTQFFIDYRFAFALLLMNWVMIKVLQYEDDKNDVRSAFEIGLFLVTASFFLPPIAYLYPILLVYFLSLRSINSSIYWMYFVGFAIPILAIVQILYLLDYTFMFDYYTERFMLDFAQWNNYFVLLMPILVVLILAIIDHIMNQNKQSANRKRMYILMIGFLMFWLVLFFLFNAQSTYYLAFLALPMSIMLGKYVKHRKSNFNIYKNAILIGFLVLMILYTFLNKMPKIYSLFGEVTI